MDTKYIEVTTTISDEQRAIQISQIIVSRKLAASVQISGPFNNIFWWGNGLETNEEYKCSFKTLASLYPKLEKELSHLHSYNPPEIVVTPIIEGLDDYFKWLDNELAPKNEDVEDAKYTEDAE